jgi:hypothetical protein
VDTKHLLTRQIGIQNPFRRGNFGLADIDTLLPRWQEEAAAAGAVVMMPPMITAWSHLP